MLGNRLSNLHIIDSLEGDGPLALIAYEEISTLRATEHYPNVVAVSNKLTAVSTSRNQLIAYAKACAYNYFEKKLTKI